jgi:hypothetical protein
MVIVLDEQPTHFSSTKEDEYKLKKVADIIELLVQRGVYTRSVAVPRFYGIWTKTVNNRMVPTF